MNKFKNYLFAGSGFAILVFAISMTNVGHSLAESCIRICPDQILPVRAVEPVPTRPVGVTPVSGGVTVNNSIAQAVPSQLPMLQEDVFQKKVNLSISGDLAEAATSFTVPAGKLLKIESASGIVFINPNLGPSWTIDIKTVANGNAGDHFISTPFGNPKVVSYQGTIYADPGSTVEVHFFADRIASLDMTLSGMYYKQP
jgi:hypothetical protein